jgi:hypothetical protein
MGIKCIAPNSFIVVQHEAFNFDIPRREGTRLIDSSETHTQPSKFITPADNFVSRSSNLWTWNKISPKLKVFDYCFSINSFKSNIKKALLHLQYAENPFTWTSELRKF